MSRLLARIAYTIHCSCCTQRRGVWDIFPYQCWVSTDNGWVLVGPHVQSERADCECQHVLEGTCDKWYCREYDDAGKYDVEHEYYSALEISEQGAVIRWAGNIDSKSEFEFSLCQCRQLSPDGSFCADWTCDEKGVSYHYPNLLWSVLHIPINIAMLIGSVEVLSKADRSACKCLVLTCVLWYIPWTILFVWLGGIGEFIITWSFTLGPFVIYYASRVLFWCGGASRAFRDLRQPKKEVHAYTTKDLQMTNIQNTDSTKHEFYEPS